MTATPTTERLIIDKEWHRLLYPLPNPYRVAEDNIQGRERQRRKEIGGQYHARYLAAAAELERTQRVEPFAVWRDGERLLLCDGRHYEYNAAKKQGFEILTSELAAGSRAEAESFMLERVLVNSGKPQHSDYYRVILANRCKFAQDYGKLAKKQQARKASDVLAHAPKQQPKNTRKLVAMLSGVGETHVGHVNKLLKEGALYLGESRWGDIENALISGDMSVRQAKRKLDNAIECASVAAALLVKEGKNPADIDVEETLGQAEEPESKQNRRRKKQQPIVSALAAQYRKLQQLKAKPDIAHHPYVNPNLEERGYRNAIIHGRFEDWLPQIPDSSGGLIFTSPPYPVDKEIAGENYCKPIPEWMDMFINPIAIEADRILRPGGRLVLNFADIFDQNDRGERTSVQHCVLRDVLNRIDSLGLSLRYREHKIWLKSIHPDRAPLGSYGSPADPQNYINDEYILVLQKGQNELPAPEGVVSDMTKDNYRQWSTRHWVIPCVSKNRFDHECPFPESLGERVIKTYSWPTDLVIDPCLGSGTTSAIAARFGRGWLGMERVEKYARHAYVRTMEEMIRARRRAEKIVKQIDEQPCAEDAPTEGVTVAA